MRRPRFHCAALCGLLASVVLLEIGVFALRHEPTEVHRAALLDRTGRDRFVSLLRLVRRGDGSGLDAAALTAALDPLCLDLAAYAAGIARLRPRLDVPVAAFLESLPEEQRRRIQILDRQSFPSKRRERFEEAVTGSWGVPQRCP